MIMPGCLASLLPPPPVTPKLNVDVTLTPRGPGARRRLERRDHATQGVNVLIHARVVKRARRDFEHDGDGGTQNSTLSLGGKGGRSAWRLWDYAPIDLRADWLATRSHYDPICLRAEESTTRFE